MLPRLSKYKRFYNNQYALLHDGYSYDQIMTVSREFIKNTEGTLDCIAAKSYLARLFTSQGRFEEFDTLTKDLKLTGDNLVDYLILDMQSIYYIGLNDPTTDFPKSQEFHNNAQTIAEKMVFQDKWEEAIVRVLGLFRYMALSPDPAKIFNSINQILEIFDSNPSIGGAKYSFLNNLGVAYLTIGKLDLALDLLNKSFNFFSKSDFSIIQIIAIANYYFMKNELGKSKESLAVALERSDQSTNYWLKTMPLRFESIILEHEQKFDDLEKNLVKNLQIANDFGNNYKIFLRNLDLYIFYLNRFKNTDDNVYITKANEIKMDLEQLALKQPNISTIKRLTNYANALIYRFGTIKQKFKAVEIYEELIKIYPHRAQFRLDLIELYWNDLEYDVNGESKARIDELIAELEKLPLMTIETHNSLTISFKILIAKYNFYINGKTKEALESLYSLQSTARSHGYVMIDEKLNKEIMILERDSKWNRDDPSLKERFNKFKITSYIEGAKSLLASEFKN